jgi:hypothetical protein
MTKNLFRLGALILGAVVTSPAWASWNDIVALLPSHMPQPGALAMMGIAVIGVLVGRFASRKRHEP